MPADFFIVGRILSKSLLYWREPRNNKFRKHLPALMRLFVWMSSCPLVYFSCIISLSIYLSEKIIVLVFRAGLGRKGFFLWLKIIQYSPIFTIKIFYVTRVWVTICTFAISYAVFNPSYFFPKVLRFFFK